MKSLTVILTPNQYKSQTSAISSDKVIDAIGITKEKGKNLFLQAENALKTQANALGVPMEIRRVDESFYLPEVKTDLVLILDENTYLPPKYLEKAIAASSLFSFALLCGPVINQLVSKTYDWFIDDISSAYKSYKIDMFNCGSIKLTSRKDYPNINNVILTKESYNYIGGYTCLIGAKVGTIYNNRDILNSVEGSGDIVYVSDLGVRYLLNSDELSHSSICKYFYSLGYLDAIIIPYDEIDQAVWEKYVNNSEQFDYSMPIWVAIKDHIKDEKKKKEYVRKLVTFKTLYNLGFSECIDGGSII